MVQRTRIKICGLTRPEDVDAVVEAGADAIGFVFHPASRRCVTPAQARVLRQRVPPFVSVVALLVNPDARAVAEILDTVQPDLLQFHGDESPAFCDLHGARYLKAFRVGGPGQETAAALAAYCQGYRHAAGWLFDSYSAGFGGSGLSFDLALLAGLPRGPGAPALIVSGGLTAATVGAAVTACRPFGVDVSSGVESAPGVKDAGRVRAFIAAVRGAEHAHSLK